MALLIIEDKARCSIRRAYIYGSMNFGIHTAKKFGARIEHCIRLIADQPHLGKQELLLVNRPYMYRSFVVLENFKVIYRVDEIQNVVYIVDFWDVRQEPNRLVEKTK